jgi:hypothetical protein
VITHPFPAEVACPRPKPANRQQTQATYDGNDNPIDEFAGPTHDQHKSLSGLWLIIPLLGRLEPLNEPTWRYSIHNYQASPDWFGNAQRAGGTLQVGIWLQLQTPADTCKNVANSPNPLRACVLGEQALVLHLRITHGREFYQTN